MLLFASTDREVAPDVRVWEARIVGVLAEALEYGGVSRPVTSATLLANVIRGHERERLLVRTLPLADLDDRVFRCCGR